MLTYLLVDFENVQPQDMSLLRGEDYRIVVFRGPHQNKLDFEIAEALQPLGKHVRHVQSARQGKNALDFLVAFSMGRLLQELEVNGQPGRTAARFIVISKDGGFDALLDHVRSLGYEAGKAESIRAMLGLRSSEVTAVKRAESDPPNALVSPAVGLADPQAAVITFPSVPGALDESIAPGGAPAPKEPAPSSKKPPAPKTQAVKTRAVPPQTVTSGNGAPDARHKVIQHLRANVKNRPAKRITLERHITSLLGGKTTARTVQELINGLVGDGIVNFVDSKIQYKIPKAK